MTAAMIAAALGGAHRSGGWWPCRCPVHQSRSSTLALRDGDRGIVIKCWAGCDPRNVLAELRQRGLILGGGKHFRTTVSPPPVGRDDAAGRVALARRIWDAAGDALRSPVVPYLVGRGITLDPPSSLRYAPALRCSEGTSGPAMVARIDSLDGELIGIARVWLHRDHTGTWRRRDRAMLGRAAGGPVRLASAAETLLIAEGIETALSGIEATGLPAWAALSTSGLVALALPPIVRHVVILADHDTNGAGERAARTVAARWQEEGRQVRIAMPPEPGSDFNDVLLGRNCTEARDVA
jgi:putative DNA primase/helicase